jgi:hypothetical protein
MVARARRSNICLGRRQQFRFAPSPNLLAGASWTAMAEDPLAKALRVRPAAEQQRFAAPAASPGAESMPARFSEDAGPPETDSQTRFADHGIEPALPELTPLEASAPQPAAPAETAITNRATVTQTEDSAAPPASFVGQEPLERPSGRLRDTASDVSVTTQPISTGTAPTAPRAVVENAEPPAFEAAPAARAVNSTFASAPAPSTGPQPPNPIAAMTPEEVLLSRNQAVSESASAPPGVAQATFVSGAPDPLPGQRHVQSATSSPAAEPPQQAEAVTAAHTRRQQHSDGEDEPATASSVTNPSAPPFGRAAMPPHSATGRLPIGAAASPPPMDSPPMAQNPRATRAEPSPQRRVAESREAGPPMSRAAEFEDRLAIRQARRAADDPDPQEGQPLVPTTSAAPTRSLSAIQAGEVDAHGDGKGEPASGVSGGTEFDHSLVQRRVVEAGPPAAPARQPQQRTPAPPASDPPQASQSLSAPQASLTPWRADTPAGTIASLQPKASGAVVSASRAGVTDRAPPSASPSVIHIDIGRIQIDLPRRQRRSRPQPPSPQGKPRGGPDT